MSTETPEVLPDLDELDRSLGESKSLAIGQLRALGMSQAELLQRVEKLEAMVKGGGLRHRREKQRREKN